MPKFFDRCCNPFNLDKHLKKSSLRNLPKYLAVHFHLSTNDRVYNTENLPEDTDDESNASFETDDNVHNEIISVEESPDTFASTPSSSGQELLVQQSSSSLSAMSLSTTLPNINDASALLNQSPVAAKRRTSETYLDDKVNRVSQSLRKAVGVKNYINPEFSYSDADEIINSLRDKFNDDTTSRSTRVQILTLLPSS
ncbi:hypothetical protein KQX54_011327 [Cotesia glomerata]|uniref:Uncharacterized protein n=1 Tax=Cotesia glomerata TaxID=32391 RepID=A0AAV7HT04_COTGL|nr:hypothetical protein KQX54_011327 [Cotesia glomerata]